MKKEEYQYLSILRVHHEFDSMSMIVLQVILFTFMFFKTREVHVYIGS